MIESLRLNMISVIFIIKVSTKIFNSIKQHVIIGLVVFFHLLKTMLKKCAVVLSR